MVWLKELLDKLIEVMAAFDKKAQAVILILFIVCGLLIYQILQESGRADKLGIEYRETIHEYKKALDAKEIEKQKCMDELLHEVKKWETLYLDMQRQLLTIKKKKND